MVGPVDLHGFEEPGPCRSRVVQGHRAVPEAQQGHGLEAGLDAVVFTASHVWRRMARARSATLAKHEKLVARVAGGLEDLTLDRHVLEPIVARSRIE